MCFRDPKAVKSPRTATLNVPRNYAKVPGAMVADIGEITGVRLSKVDSKMILMVNNDQLYYVEKQMAQAFGYGVGDKVKVWKHSDQYYFTATKGAR